MFVSKPIRFPIKDFFNALELLRKDFFYSALVPRRRTYVLQTKYLNNIHTISLKKKLLCAQLLTFYVVLISTEVEAIFILTKKIHTIIYFP